VPHIERINLGAVVGSLEIDRTRSAIDGTRNGALPLPPIYLLEWITYIRMQCPECPP